MTTAGGVEYGDVQYTVRVHVRLIRNDFPPFFLWTRSKPVRRDTVAASSVWATVGSRASAAHGLKFTHGLIFFFFPKDFVFDHH